ncbi:hypothetical protein F4775DRAFT_542466 [Biscogniauxia sp. FL1348]|nr:hypothetical protein F4775DRAFT_542466 [Biscogniauxia sp. FL1348]
MDALFRGATETLSSAYQVPVVSTPFFSSLFCLCVYVCVWCVYTQGGCTGVGVMMVLVVLWGK